MTSIDGYRPRIDPAPKSRRISSLEIRATLAARMHCLMVLHLKLCVVIPRQGHGDQSVFAVLQGGILVDRPGRQLSARLRRP